MKWLKAFGLAILILIAGAAAAAGVVLTSDTAAALARTLSNDLVEIWADAALAVTEALRG